MRALTCGTAAGMRGPLLLRLRAGTGHGARLIFAAPRGRRLSSLPPALHTTHINFAAYGAPSCRPCCAVRMAPALLTAAPPLGARSRPPRARRCNAGGPARGPPVLAASSNSNGATRRRRSRRGAASAALPSLAGAHTRGTRAGRAAPSSAASRVGVAASPRNAPRHGNSATHALPHAHAAASAQAKPRATPGLRSRARAPR
jgi:hypothetical protein